MKDIFLSAKELNELKKTKQNIIIFDSSYFLPNTGINAIDEYNNEHIEDSVFFDIDKISDPNNDLPHMFPSKDVFETHMQKLGLNNDDIVIIYDNSPLLSSARCWFLLRYFGHKEIFILSGGIKSWKENGFVTTNEVSNISFGNFKATEENKKLLIKIEEMKNISDNKFFPILDARSFERFSGSGQEPRPNLESGHIPNSLNLPASKLLDKNGNLISKSDFKNLINDLNLNENEKVITTCGSGVSACVIALSYYRIGNENIPVYDGSWSEWASKNMKINKL